MASAIENSNLFCHSLTLSCLAGYLPYGLKGKSLNGLSDDIDEVIGCYSDFNLTLKSRVNSHNTVDYGCDLKDFKPILFPLSSLTKEIEINGEKFVPSEWYKKHSLFGDCKNSSYSDFRIEYLDPNTHNTTYFESVYKENDKEATERFFLSDYHKLQEWKFDIHNLIEKGLAIAVTEEFNPYK